MEHIITGVVEGSIAEELGIHRGDILTAINGSVIHDVVDYKYFEAEENLVVSVKSGEEIIDYEIEKDSDEELGLVFSTQLMSPLRSCANKCVFCFVDQLPGGVRDSMKYKDDDWRLSFLMGNYVTLTNVTDREFDRLIARRVSPLYISVHATDPTVREKMLGNKNAGAIMTQLRRLAEARIYFNAQIVLCPSLNDGIILDRSINDLSTLYPYCKSLSVVPVGLTGHRAGLPPIKKVDKPYAEKLLGQVSRWQHKFMEWFGEAFVYAADEFYALTGERLPNEGFYGEYEQLDNGVGMLTLMKSEVDRQLAQLKDVKPKQRRLALITGVSAYLFISECLEKVLNTFGQADARVFEIVNDYFGHSVTVAGLICGSDIIKQMRDKGRFDEMLLPANMLRAGTDIFLDGSTVQDVERALGTRVRKVDPFGGDFVYAVLGIEEDIA